MTEYGYLYQSTCGWTFTMPSNIAIQNMTQSQYDDYWEGVVNMNERVCKLHGEKPTYNYAFNQKSSSDVEKRKF